VEATEKATDDREPICVRDAAALGIIGSRHGAKLVESEEPPSHAWPLLPEYCRRPDLNDHEHGQQQEKG
jgi:hypothetical protein